ncbi:MAG: penicillin-binding transpeptidase domain-containing protein [Candidatus Heteroscillospira sp.]|jgi:stage V sporulation protein D (sporulation-specific penicillin-binding protein)
MSEENSRSNRRPSRMMLRRTLFLLIVCGVAAFAAVGVRLFRLQVLDHELYESRAIEQQLRSTTITAHRGTIYDRSGHILAMSATADTIYISPVEIAVYGEDVELISSGLAEILGVSAESIAEKAGDRSSWYKTVAVKVDENTAARVRAFKNEHSLNGIKIETDTKRCYPGGTLASHVVGFVGIENSGLSGVEAYYDAGLTGTNGRVVRAKNSAGTDMLFTNFEEYRDARSGNDHVLTIDSGLQYYLEKHLKQASEDYDVRNGAGGIVMDVNTGEILAMASLGDFDLNNYQRVDEDLMEEILAEPDADKRGELLSAAQQKQWRNKALSDTYEPGSTFKIITLAMALDSGAVTKADSFYCGGSIAVQGRNTPAKCWKSGGHGSQSLIQSLQHSCNVAFVNIGLRVGAEKFYEYARNFGFFDKTGLDLYGESGSIWWPEEVFFNKENLSQLAAASFGQTFNITPLQLITAVSACVNGGNLMKPYVLREVRDADGNTLSVTEPTKVRQVISAETSAIVREALEQVVGDKKEGTGKNAAVAGYRIGGKTGTSEKVAQNINADKKEYIVSFVGVAPMDDPRIAVLVLLDTPGDSGVYVSGGQMAAPTVGKFFADALPYMGIEPNYSPEELEELSRTVPALSGMSVEKAESSLRAAGLSARVLGSGDTVISQLPEPGMSIAPGSSVILCTDGAEAMQTGRVPDMNGMTVQEAEEALAEQGLFLRSGAYGAGESVTGQSIPAGAEVSAGTIIEVSLLDASELGRY